jgi:deoxyribodipyrimidine photo-lyase
MQAGVIGFNTLRVYSPTKQFMDQDPNGYFVKNWVPELADQTVTEIAKTENRKIKGYTSPIVLLSDRSKQMKDRIYSIRKSTGGKKATQKTLKDHGSKKTPSHKKKRKDEGQLFLFKS